MLLERASGPVWRETQAARRADEAHQARRWTDDHREIVAALSRGAGEAAAAVSRRHLLRPPLDNVACCAWAAAVTTAAAAPIAGALRMNSATLTRGAGAAAAISRRHRDGAAPSLWERLGCC